MGRSRELESTYQHVLYVISGYSNYFEVIDVKYPKLVIEDKHTKERFEIIIKRAKGE